MSLADQMTDSQTNETVKHMQLGSIGNTYGFLSATQQPPNISFLVSFVTYETCLKMQLGSIGHTYGFLSATQQPPNISFLVRFATYETCLKMQLLLPRPVKSQNHD